MLWLKDSFRFGVAWIWSNSVSALISDDPSSDGHAPVESGGPPKKAVKDTERGDRSSIFQRPGSAGSATSFQEHHFSKISKKNVKMCKTHPFTGPGGPARLSWFFKKHVLNTRQTHRRHHRIILPSRGGPTAVPTSGSHQKVGRGPSDPAIWAAMKKTTLGNIDKSLQFIWTSLPCIYCMYMYIYILPCIYCMYIYIYY